MPTWEARVSGATAPVDRVDAEVRYAFAAPLLRDAALWIDLGCGTGVAAGAALAGGAVARAVLVDRSAEALAQARRECGAEVAAAVEADLETAEGIAAVRAAIAEARGAAVTCFDVLHQLTDFTALVELLLALAAEGATVVLSVPDDTAGALDDPHRATAWSAGAAEELRRLVPDGAVVARQVPVRAAAIVVDGESAPLGTVSISADHPAAHHLLAFGPDAARLAPVSHAHAAPLDDERADARRRESDLAYLEARVAQLEGPGA
jgi:SAM-dependent methyltransferase